RTQLTAYRDRFVRSLRDRRFEQVHLLDYFRELTAASCERQSQGRDCDREAAAGGRRVLDVGLGQRQLSRRLLQPPVRQLNCRMSQSQLGMIGCCARRERSKQGGNRSLLPVERQTEQVVRE